MINTNNFIVSALKPVDFNSFQSSEVTSDDKKSTKSYKTYAYTGACAETVLFGGLGYSVAHDDFKTQKSEIIKNYNNKLNKFIDMSIKKRKEIEGNIPQSEIDEITNICKERYAMRLNIAIAKLKNNFKSIYIKKTIYGTLCGAALGSLLLLKTHNEIKKKQTK